MHNENLSILHRLTHTAILDCLVSDSAGVMPLFRDIIARTGQRPDVDAFVNLLGAMCDRGLLVEILPEGMSREQVFEQYQKILPLTQLADLTADAIGAVYIPTQQGRLEWEQWRRSFDGAD